MAVYGLLLCCVIVFFWQAHFLMLGDRAAAYRFSLVPTHITSEMIGSWAWLLAATTIITSLFLHANLVHLCFNMLFLTLFGRRLEQRLGPFVFAALYLGAGVAASVALVCVSPHATVHLLGASGAVAGVLGAVTLLYPRLKVNILWPMWTRTSTGWIFTWTEQIEAVFFLTGWILFQAIFALDSTPGLAWIAHCAGFGAGMVFVLPLIRSRRADRQL